MSSDPSLGDFEEKDKEIAQLKECLQKMAEAWEQVSAKDSRCLLCPVFLACKPLDTGGANER